MRRRILSFSSEGGVSEASILDISIITDVVVSCKLLLTSLSVQNGHSTKGINTVYNMLHASLCSQTR